LGGLALATPILAPYAQQLKSVVNRAFTSFSSALSSKTKKTGQTKEFNLLWQPGDLIV
jgi:hypothetical protein